MVQDLAPWSLGNKGRSGSGNMLFVATDKPDRPRRQPYRKITLEVLVPNSPKFISWLVAMAIQICLPDIKDIRVVKTAAQEEDHL